MADKKKWIAGAIQHPGTLTAQAKKAGMSLSEFCAKRDLTGRTQKRCSLRKTLMSFRKK